jgi:kynureninase
MIQARHLTVRNLPPQVAKALDSERRRRRQSLNQTVIDLLGQSLGVGPGARRSNGLAKLAGGWNEEQAQGFEVSLQPFAEVDAELWR